MTWKQFFTSSIGKKFVMALTGTFLILFLLVHASVNAQIFWNDQGVFFNQVAHFLSHNLIMKIMEVGLFVTFIIHIIQGLVLWKQNSAARPIGYRKNDPSKNSKWYSRSMGLLGTLLLIFLIIHLSHFWIGTKNDLYFENDKETNLFGDMVRVFSNPVVVVFYLLGLASLCYHLLQGFQSAFQTFGWNHKKYTPLIKAVGIGYSLIITLLFASMPLAVYFKWITLIGQ